MNSKLERTTKETIVILALVILAVFAIVAILWNRDTADAYSGSIHLTTGECGYYQQAGTLHRNGLVTPDHCTIPAGNTVAEEPEKPATEEPEKPATEKPATEEPEKPEKPATEKPEEPATEKPEKPATEKPVHCNNGNGNGAEGCNASDSPHSNQDETPNRRDNTAGESHGNSGEHGKGGKK